MSVETQSTEDRLRQQFSVEFHGRSHYKTKQAEHYESGQERPLEDIPGPHDGQAIYHYFGLAPFHKILKRLEWREHNIIEYPSAYLDALIHVDDAEIWALEDGDLGYFEEMGASHNRMKVMEFFAERPELVEALSDGGTDLHAHSKPGKGKTSFGMLPGVVRMMEVNNETVLWPLPADESGIVEEVEMLPLAPFTTLLRPKGVELGAEFVPKDPRLQKFEVDLTTPFPFRHVIEYEDPIDILQNIVVPGGLYAILPDPKFRKCEQLTVSNYNTPWEAEKVSQVTRLRHWDHALMRARAKSDQFLHPSVQIEDEFSDLVPMNARADASDTHVKTKAWPETYGKARKKNHSLISMSHSLKRIDEDVLEKERWFVTLPDTPIPGKVPGMGSPPIRKKGYMKGKPKGTAAIWNSAYFNDLSWENPYRVLDFQGELNIWYPEWQEALSNV